MSVLSDLSLHLTQVNNSDTVVCTDTQVLKQSLIRLTQTQQGEIYNYRAYGMDIKKWFQYPLTESTAREIESYVIGQISTFQSDVTYIDSASEIIIDYNNNYIKFNLVYQLNLTGEIISLPTISVPVSS